MEAKKIFNGWFLGWTVIAIIGIITMLLIPKTAKTSSAIIMATFMVMPIRDWFYRLIVWGLNYISSVNTSFKDRINPYATMNSLLEPTKRFDNVGFYRILKATIALVCFILALLWMIFQSVSFDIVYGVLYSIEGLVTGKIGPIKILLYILMTLLYGYEVYWAGGQALNGKLYDNIGNLAWSKAWWRLLIMVVSLFAKIIISGILLNYTAGMIFHSIIFWVTVISIPVALYEITLGILKILQRNP